MIPYNKCIKLRKILATKDFNDNFLVWKYTQKRNVHYDLAIIGGGIIGTATANEALAKFPKQKIVLLEKECKLAKHQTGHNSGVVHAGIYYAPGSLKANLCRKGMQKTFEYCEKKNIPLKKIGKLVVATNETEVKNLNVLYDRSIKNEVPGVKLLESEEEIKKIEPQVTGLKAIWSPETAIVDWSLVTKELSDDFLAKGGDIKLNYEVKSIESSEDKSAPIQINDSRNNKIHCKYLLTCGGLQSDRLSVMTGCPESPKIVPIRGEYLVLKESMRDVVKCNIYPVPDPAYPFLGVHFTPRMDGSIWLGPNAVLACSREGYGYLDINLFDVMEMIKYKGFLNLVKKYYAKGMTEMLKSLVTYLQVKQLKKYVPKISHWDVYGGPAGVRAQALFEDGTMVEDFYFDMTKDGPLKGRVLHCRNVPSPGATSSMAIAEYLVQKMKEEFYDQKMQQCN